MGRVDFIRGTASNAMLKPEETVLCRAENTASAPNDMRPCASITQATMIVSALESALKTCAKPEDIWFMLPVRASASQNASCAWRKILSIYSFAPKEAMTSNPASKLLSADTNSADRFDCNAWHFSSFLEKSMGTTNMAAQERSAHRATMGW